MNRHMHFIWVGSPLPERFANNIGRWRTLHPDWKITLWRDTDLDWLDHSDLLNNAAKFVPSGLEGQFYADIARYEILHKHAGFYADVDTYPLRPIDDALARRDEFAAWEVQDRFIGNTYLYAREAQHPIFIEILRGLRASVDAAMPRRTRPARMTGPQYISPIWRQRGGFIAPQAQWYPYLWSDVKRRRIPEYFEPDVYAVHEWANTNRELGRPLT